LSFLTKIGINCGITELLQNTLPENLRDYLPPHPFFWSN